MATKDQITIKIHPILRRRIEALAEQETRGNRNQMIEIIFENYLGLNPWKKETETAAEKDERLQHKIFEDDK